jgi:hypothetical protein
MKRKIPVLARERGGKLNAISRGSDAASKEAKDRLLDRLKHHTSVQTRHGAKVIAI